MDWLEDPPFQHIEAHVLLKNVVPYFVVDVVQDVLDDASVDGQSIAQECDKNERHLPFRNFNSYVLPKARLIEALPSFIARVYPKNEIESHRQD